MRVGVVGVGHVGLPSSVALALLGHEVVGVDSDPEKISALQSGTSPFYEPGLHEALERMCASKALRFSEDMADAAEAEVVLICVGTPPRSSGEANLAAVESAVRGVARFAKGPMVIVEKSTVPSGTAERLRQTVRVERPDLADVIDIVSNPEFLREGRALDDWLQPDRILVGADSERAFAVMRRLFEPLTSQGHRLIETDIATAELAKHACNAFLALKISYINALAQMCELAGANVVDVATVMGSDRRIGEEFLQAGLGYGGYCFPKDLQAFARLAETLGYPFPLLEEIARINEAAVDLVFRKVRDAVWNLDHKRIALLGLSFKPDTDDVRLSPALALGERLLASDATVVGYDPQATDNARIALPQLVAAANAYEAARDAHCLVVCTAWEEFLELDLARLKDVMAQPAMVDGRNLFEPEVVVAAGFTYASVGRWTPSSR